MNEHDMSEEERKWFESLKRCMKKKPKSVEMFVQEVICNINGCTCDIHLMKAGVSGASQDEVGDLLKYNPEDYSIASFRCDGVAANNHGY